MKLYEATLADKRGFSGDKFSRAIRESLNNAGVKEIRIDRKSNEAVYGTGRRPADCPGAGLVWREVKNLDNMRKD